MGIAKDKDRQQMAVGYYWQHGTVMYWDGKHLKDEFGPDVRYLIAPHGKYLGSIWSDDQVQLHAAKVTRRQIAAGELS